MNIIRISSVSFKIILTKDDLLKHGADDINYTGDLSTALLSEIIERTNSLYGNPFGEGSIDAEFFESKEGGGELFITKAKHHKENTLLAFETKNSDDVFMLCKCLAQRGIFANSTLFYLDDTYYLIIKAEEDEKRIIYIINEFGKAYEVSEIFLWRLNEHAKLLCRDDAILRLSSFT